MAASARPKGARSSTGRAARDDAHSPSGQASPAGVALTATSKRSAISPMLRSVLRDNRLAFQVSASRPVRGAHDARRSLQGTPTFLESVTRRRLLSIAALS